MCVCVWDRESLSFHFGTTSRENTRKNLGEIYVLMKWKKRKKTFSFGHYVFGCSVSASVSCFGWCARARSYRYISDEKEKETEEIKIFLAATFLQNTFASCKTLYEQPQKRKKKWNRNDTHRASEEKAVTNNNSNNMPWNQQVRHCQFARISEYMVNGLWKRAPTDGMDA